MEFEEKYTIDSLETKKILISNDAFAVGEQISALIKKIHELVRRL